MILRRLSIIVTAILGFVLMAYPIIGLTPPPWWLFAAGFAVVASSVARATEGERNG